MNAALGLIILKPNTKPAVEIRQSQIGAILALEQAQRIAQQEIERMKGEVIRKLVADHAAVEPGAYTVELHERMRDGRLVRELVAW